MKQLYKNILGFIEKEEKNLSAKRKIELEDAYHMVVFLRHLLTDLKSEVLSTGFENKQEEITFFKSIKPEVLGKLIYYNKIVRIESFRPCSSEMLSRYYTDQIKCLKKEYKKHIGNTDFYRYHRSGRTDKDDLFFRRGNINFFDGVNSFIFEADPAFSTFYDYKTARIIAFDLIHSYLLCCLEPERSNPIFDDKIYDLGVNSYYFAGIADGKIYLGNVTTPLFISQIDTGLQNLTRTKIALDHMDHPFRNVQIRVKSPYFYIYDGNVPVIYRGNLGNSTANTISYGDAFFNQLSVIDSMKFGIRTQKRDDNQYSIALLDLNRNPKLSLKPEVLQKQIDGVFDVDGVLTSDPENGKLVYTYFYRNQFIVMDTSLNVQSRLNTIDTTTRANLSVTKLSDGRNKMNAPSFSVNKSQTLFCGLIFNRSNLKGKHEPSSSWKNSSIIDVYSTDEQYYLGSFYIRHKDGNAMSSMISDGRYLYVLIGNELQRYRIRDGAFKFNIKRNQWFEEPLVDRDI